MAPQKSDLRRNEKSSSWWLDTPLTYLDFVNLPLGCHVGFSRTPSTIIKSHNMNNFKCKKRDGRGSSNDLKLRCLGSSYWASRYVREDRWNSSPPSDRSPVLECFAAAVWLFSVCLLHEKYLYCPGEGGGIWYGRAVRASSARTSGR
jgi:hypothetical protein